MQCWCPKTSGGSRVEQTDLSLMKAKYRYILLIGIFPIDVFTEFSEFSEKIYWSLKGLEPATSCARDQDACYHNASKTYVRDKIFELSPIHASVIYQIP